MKDDLSFPLIEHDRSIFPGKPECPWCGNPNVFEPDSFAFIAGGASIASTEAAGVLAAGRKHGYLSLVWHGAHDAGVGRDAGIYASVDLADQVEAGQFELHFCSTQCMRAFLNACVDRLEESIAVERTRDSVQ